MIESVVVFCYCSCYLFNSPKYDGYDFVSWKVSLNEYNKVFFGKFFFPSSLSSSNLNLMIIIMFNTRSSFIIKYDDGSIHLKIGFIDPWIDILTLAKKKREF